MTTALQSHVVPESIVRKLRDLIWRARLVMALRGAMATLAAAIVSVLAIMAIDYWVVIFSDWLRWTLSLSGLGLTILVALWFVVRPLARSFTLTGIARLIELRHPELQERISSTVELLTSEDGPEFRGSDALIAALADEAVLDAQAVRPSREVNFRAAFPYLLTAGIVLVVLVSVIAIWPSQAERLFRRALLANVSRVSHTALHVSRISAPDLKEWNRDGFDYVMMAGRRLHVELEVADDAVSTAHLRRSASAGGEENAVSMTRLPDGAEGERCFALTCPPAAESFRFRLHAGDALTRYYYVKVVEQPAIRRIDLRYEYPAYTGREPDFQPSAGGNVGAVAGTVATITARTNKPVTAAEFLVDGKPQLAETPAEEGGATLCTFRLRLTKDMKTRWSARLEDEYGFRNEPAEYAIKALPDKRPRVDVTVPNTTRLKLKPTDRLPVTYRLRDDFGLASAALLVEIDGQQRDPVPLAIPAAAKPQQRIDGQTLLDLSALPLEGARQVTFRIRATDIVPPELSGPQEGFSDLFAIQLDVKAPSFVEQIVLAEELRLREVLQEVLKELKEAKKDSSPLRQMVPKARTVTEAVIARVDRMRKHLGSADSMLRKVIDETAGGIYASFTDKLRSLADDHVAKALDLAGQIKLTDQPKQRAAVADEADFQVDRSIAIVNELLKELGALTEQLTRALELQELAAEQDELTDALAEMENPPDPNDLQPAGPEQGDVEPMTPEEWRKAQEQLADRMANLAKQTPGAVEAQLRRDKERTKDLLAEARKLTREQNQLRQDTQEAARLEKLAQALENLAERQRALAREAAATKAAADQAKPMEQAADEIKAGQLAEAIDKQQGAEKALDSRAQQGAEAKTTESLADQAQRLAKQQESLAKRAEGARQNLQAADAKADAGRKQGAETKKKAAEADKRLAKEGQSLQQKQQALAERARALHKEAAANPATADEANRTQPAATMDQAAREAAQQKMDQAAAQARGAEQQADQLARDLDGAAKRAAGAPKEQRDDRQAQAAGQAAQKAKQIAEAQKSLAEQFAQAAQQARGAEQQARQEGQQAAAEESAGRQAAAQAKQQTQGLTAEQQDLARQAAELGRRAAKAGERARQAAEKHDPTGEMKQAARAMAAAQAPEAADQAAKAAEKAKQLAQALRQAAGEAPPGVKDQAPQLAQMAQKQTRLRQEVERLLAERKRLGEAVTGSELARLQREQSQLAREIGKLADDVKETAPQEDRIDTQAARSSQEAADELGRREVAKAATKATDAGEKLGEMAQRLSRQAGRQPAGRQGQQAQEHQPAGQPGEKQPGQPSGQPSAQPSQPQVAAQGSTAQEPEQVGGKRAAEAAKRASLADSAEDLGQRQRQLAREIKALAEGDATALMASRQANLGERTAELGKDVDRIQEHAEELIPDEAARREAASAARHLDRAEAAQQEAGKALEAGKASQALSPEAQSGQALASAAASLERLGRMLAEAAGRQHPPEAAEDSQDVADAYDSTDQAADTQQVSDAALAAEQLQALAQSAMARARALGLPIGQMTPMSMAQMLTRPSRNLDSRFGTGPQLTDLTAAKLEKLGISLSDWARLPGNLRDQVLQAAASQSPEEYRSLIRRYFREVARRGGGGGGADKTAGDDTKK